MTESFRRAPTVEITQSLLSTVPASESLLEIVLCRSNCLMLGWPDLEDSFPNCCKVAEELTAEKQKRNLKKQVSIGKSRPDLFFSTYSFSFFFFPFIYFLPLFLGSLVRWHTRIWQTFAIDDHPPKPVSSDWWCEANLSTSSGKVRFSMMTEGNR